MQQSHPSMPQKRPSRADSRVFLYRYMFAASAKIAAEFTRPVVISHRLFSGRCESGIGAFVVVNDQGWILTAWHMLDQIMKLNTAVTAFKAHQTKREAIGND